MKKTSLESLVLRTKKTGEYNKLVFLFTRNRGKILAVAFGARKTRNRFGSALEPFSHGRAMLIEKKNSGLLSLDQFDLIKSSFELYEDYAVASHLYYYSELIDLLLPEEQPDDNIFRLTLEMLRGFHERLAPNVVAAYFETWLLKLLGVLPEHSKCHHCSAVLKPGGTVYMAAAGYFFCKGCYLKGLDEGKEIPGEMIRTLNLIFKSKIDNKALSSKRIGALPVTKWTGLLFQRTVEREIKSYDSLKTIREY